LNRSFLNPQRQVKYVMDDYSSIDIDDESDWFLAEFFMKNNIQNNP